MQKRPIEVDGDIAYIPLTLGYVAIIDAADVPIVQGRNWFADVCGRTVYARCKLPGTKQWRPSVKLHRLLMPGAPTVDHIDGDGLNNRRSNLRPATKAENSRNSRTPKSNSSGIKGVSWHKRTNRWIAQIGLNYKTHHLGIFATKEEAALAYARACIEMHGAFARLEPAHNGKENQNERP